MEKSKSFTNFYENMKEVDMRLTNTVVTYDGIPYYILCVSDHKPDGVFRVYLDPVGKDMEAKIGNAPYMSGHASERGKAMDDWMERQKDCKILRKMMNSPSFNRFRPFPLGMANYNGKVIYLERQPVRITQQGLMQNHVDQSAVTLSDRKGLDRKVDILSEEFRQCVVGEYPDAVTCLQQLLDPGVSNEGAAFHREFALMRGPIGTVFLAYKTDVVGLLPEAGFGQVRLSKSFGHLKEVTEELGLFGSVVINNF